MTVAAPFERLAAWRRLDVADGLGIVRLVALGEGSPPSPGFAAQGWEIVARRDRRGRAWVVHFDARLDEIWQTRLFRAEAVSGSGARRIVLEADGDGHWRLNGRRAGRLDGCIDVDIVSTPFTNTFPIRRLDLRVDEERSIRVAWIDVPSLVVRAVTQGYRRLPAGEGLDRYEYVSPTGRRYRLSVDPDGLVVDYESFAARVA